MDPKPIIDYATLLRQTPVRYVALRTALYYLLFGILWILGSDLTVRLLPDPLETQLQTIKGSLFIVITALLLFFLVRRFVRQMKEAELNNKAQLEGIAAQYQRLFERSPMAMFIFDPESRRILAVNDVALIMYGYPRDTLLTMTTLDLIVEEDRARAIGLTQEYQRDSVISVGPYQVRRRDGRILLVDAITHRVEFNGKPARIALMTDQTQRLQTERTLAQYRAQLEQRVGERTAELSRANHRLEAEVQQRRRIEEDLRAASAAAEAANAAKSSFLTNTSHEIRTPLTSIMGYTDLLEDDSLTATARREYLGVVGQNARHLLALIDDLLDLSRAESGKVRVTVSEQRPRDIARECIDQMLPRSAEKGLALRLSVESDVPELIRTDGVRLRQILLNLLSNAIKFTTDGSVVLSVYLPPRRDDWAVGFDVTDTGPGIDAEHMHHIFEPFYQVEQGTTRRVGGVGLGLTIARQLTFQMGGELTLRSKLGQGTTFSLVLPHSAVATGDVSSGGMLSGHILLAEDTPNIRLLVEEYLSRAGARVTAVSNGAEAVNAVRNAQGGDGRFDLVLLDLHMPVLDGAGALMEIRGLGYAGPIVGLTADYPDRTDAQWSAAGWTAMAAKPIDRQAFIPLLARLMPPPPRETPPTPKTAANPH